MIHHPTKHPSTTTFGQYLKNRQAWWLLVFCLLGLTSSVQAEPRENWNYESRFTAEGFKASGKSGTYAYDPHVWVYTTAFAKRFGMPEKWIDDSLKGAEALAYRVDRTYYIKQCGYFGDMEKCRTPIACMLDLYIPSSANLPWNTELRYDSRYGKKSVRALTTNEPSSIYKRITKRGTHLLGAKFGLDLVGIVYGKDKRSSIGSYTIAEYERGLYKNLDYISGTTSCTFQRVKDAEVRINQPVFRENGSVNVSKSYNKIAHKIEIPNSFMDRVESYAEKEYEPESLTKALEDNLKQKGE
ncbi:hypothetical protein [Thiomicrospira sp. S5]|uniref:hypothetical protein n=1 Tax=Thiomicrospira sp. S5 TaxID=1803865 RepID=UPI000F8A0CF0|nr:hypothetical protein [Thiomicrospira sp. S5]AZR80877.1 hypothetical protein AYJ59_00370 [Thiomicrospira sp. S5]